jgi:hypothetical protein
VFAIVATVLFGLDVAGTNGAMVTQATKCLFLGLLLVMAPVAQATGLAAAPAAVGFGIIFLLLFLALAAIELIVMRLLKGRSAKARWIVRLSALLAFALILFFTPPAGPGRMF